MGNGLSTGVPASVTQPSRTAPATDSVLGELGAEIVYDKRSAHNQLANPSLLLTLLAVLVLVRLGSSRRSARGTSTALSSSRSLSNQIHPSLSNPSIVD